MKYFPVMASERISGILWEEVAPHEKQAKDNHDQSLNMLAQRGGLDVIELWCVVNDMTWHKIVHPGIPHKEVQKIANDCEDKLIERFGDKLRTHTGRRGPK